MNIDQSLSTSEIQAKYGLSRTTAWRAKRRGWAIGAAYHQRQASATTHDVGVEMSYWNDLKRYAASMLQEAPACDWEDIASNAILLALNRGVTPDGPLKLKKILVATARSLCYSYRKQGQKSIAAAVQNWTYNQL